MNIVVLRTIDAQCGCAGSHTFLYIQKPPLSSNPSTPHKYPLPPTRTILQYPVFSCYATAGTTKRDPRIRCCVISGPTVHNLQLTSPLLRMHFKSPPWPLKIPSRTAQNTYCVLYLHYMHIKNSAAYSASTPLLLYCTYYCKGSFRLPYKTM